MKNRLQRLYQLLKALAVSPHEFSRVVDAAASICSARNFSQAYREAAGREAGVDLPPSVNPLRDYFQNHKEGKGIWKWEHYFEVYHRHFSRFVGQKVNVLEIGIFGGGSLEMWRSYFGEKSHIYGVDIEQACKVHENDHITVFIGDQADRAFWRAFRERAEGIDIVIDDGGHTPEQQQITLEEILPHLRPGGVYVCEDIHHVSNRFAGFVAGLVAELNEMNVISDSPFRSSVSRFQASVHSIHFYPYIVVIEKHGVSPTSLSAPRHGTKWPPFSSA